MEEEASATPDKGELLIFLLLRPQFCAGFQELEEENTAMKIRIYSLFFSLGLLAAMLATAYRVQATLGESADSVESDREALSAARSATTFRKEYTIQEIDFDATIVREYVSPSGMVFAIAWNGLVHPDLTQLLGSYADEYERALAKAPREWDRSRHRVKTNQVVVEKWGHMRNLQGRAYAPALIPPGVSLDEIN
ncbi:MAG: DUF2844 domain-containing protein [Thermodesulfobacteriota bacterium]